MLEFVEMESRKYMQFEIHSIEDTRAFAQKMASLLQGKQMVICLGGDLGAGKTTWTKAFGKALGVKGVINSPTFTIMKSYKQADGKPLFHIDAYRLEGTSQDLGFEDCFDEGICVIEWSHFIEDQIPEEYIRIQIEEGIEENRTITMEANGMLASQIVEEFAHD